MLPIRAFFMLTFALLTGCTSTYHFPPTADAIWYSPTERAGVAVRTTVCGVGGWPSTSFTSASGGEDIAAGNVADRATDILKRSFNRKSLDVAVVIAALSPMILVTSTDAWLSSVDKMSKPDASRELGPKLMKERVSHSAYSFSTYVSKEHAQYLIVANTVDDLRVFPITGEMDIPDTEFRLSRLPGSSDVLEVVRLLGR